MVHHLVLLKGKSPLAPEILFHSYSPLIIFFSVLCHCPWFCSPVDIVKKQTTHRVIFNSPFLLLTWTIDCYWEKWCHYKFIVWNAIKFSIPSDFSHALILPFLTLWEISPSKLLPPLTVYWVSFPYQKTTFPPIAWKVIGCQLQAFSPSYKWINWCT